LVSRILGGLHERGLVAAVTPTSDPRRRTWSLSRRGGQMVEVLRPVWRRREAVLQACLSDAERAQLADMLERLFLASEDLRRREAKELRAERSPKKRSPQSRAVSKADLRQPKQ